MKILDIHAHVIPASLKSLIDCGIIKNVEIKNSSIVFDGSVKHPYTPNFLSEEARFEFMSIKGIDCMMISVSPRLFFYHLSSEAGAEVASTLNDDLIQMGRHFPDKQIAVGTVPLQNTDLAVKELERLSLRQVSMVQIGTSVNGKSLSMPELEPFWAAAEDKKITVMLHPLITDEFAMMGNYHMGNLVGNPWQTTVAAEDLIFSGMFQRHPHLRVILVHGGGFLPYQLGRMCHGYEVREECRANTIRNPKEFFKKNLYFDALTHSQESLNLLLSVAGTEHVLYGSDYPYDMAEYDQPIKIRNLGYSKKDIERICGGNARNLLGLKT